MSARCSGNVWKHSQHKGSDLLVLLAIADYARDDGSGAWPSVGGLAEKTRLSERSVQYILRKLVASGELVIEPHAGPRGCHLYHVTVGLGGEKIAPLGGAKFAGAKIAPGAIQRTGGVQSSVKGGAIAIAPEPLIEPLKEPLESARKNEKTRASSIPEDFEVTAHLREWAYEHCPDLDLERETEKFIAYYEARGTSMKRWDAAWRNWMLKAVDYTAKENRNNGKHPKDEAAERFLQAGFALVRGGQTLNPGNDDRPRLRRPGT